MYLPWDLSYIFFENNGKKRIQIIYIQNKVMARVVFYYSYKKKSSRKIESFAGIVEILNYFSKLKQKLL